MPEITVAYPGTEGSFSYAAAREAFAGEAGVVFHGYTTFEEAAAAVTGDNADYALLPVENSYAGAVLTTYGLIEKLPLWIVRETTKQVRQQLLVVPGTKLSDIRVISSHPQALSQCRGFLQTLPGVTTLPSENTAISAREAARKGDPSFAAIASEEAAAAFGLEILCRDIQDSQNNTTRFFVLSRQDQPLGEPDKATVVFTVNDTIGALAKVLTVFADCGMNMSRIESRPIPETTFAYFFSVDFEGVNDRAVVDAAMQAAAPYMRDSRLLGLYPSVTTAARRRFTAEEV